MKNYRTRIKKIFTRFTDIDMSKAEFNPYRDWKFILLGSFMGLVFVVVSNIFLFIYLELTRTIDDESASIATQSLNIAGIESVLKIYDEKAKHLDALLNDRDGAFENVADPSL